MDIVFLFRVVPGHILWSYVNSAILSYFFSLLPIGEKGDVKSGIGCYVGAEGGLCVEQIARNFLAPLRNVSPDICGTWQ